mmetsp:Transcript_8135/g.28147  ORF Transcript_8135/g.28147 Transcript_8135/m.28147 type:complete len:248 (-) Transcript_8135:1797-2540(-)
MRFGPCVRRAMLAAGALRRLGRRMARRYVDSGRVGRRGPAVRNFVSRTERGPRDGPHAAEHHGRGFCQFQKRTAAVRGQTRGGGRFGRIRECESAALQKSRLFNLRRRRGARPSRPQRRLVHHHGSELRLLPRHLGRHHAHLRPRPAPRRPRRRSGDVCHPRPRRKQRKSPDWKRRLYRRHPPRRPGPSERVRAGPGRRVVPRLVLARRARQIHHRRRFQRHFRRPRGGRARERRRRRVRVERRAGE